jgi:glutathione S-transferase
VKLHYAPLTRAMRPHWMLEELGIPYELVNVDLAARRHQTPEHRRLHPLGRVPVLVDDEGRVLFESAAICMQLADAHPAARLAPPTGTPERGLYYQWILCAVTELEPAIRDAFLHQVQLPPEKRSPEALARARQIEREVSAAASAPVRGQEWLLGGGFSAADIIMGDLFVAACRFGVLEDAPAVEAWLERIAARPAFQRARAHSFRGHHHD